MAQKKPTDKKEGGLNLESDRAEFEGPVAGRDNVTNYSGLSGEEAKGLLETVLKHFTQKVVSNPDELSKALSDFRIYHEKLHEYKELHNAVNDIQIAFGQFRVEVDRANSTRSLPKLGILRDRWRPVSMNVVALLNWSQTIKNIGKPFRVLEDKGKSGEDWAIQFSELQSRINQHLGVSDQLGVTSNKEVEYPSQLQIILFKQARAEIPWWESLSELTSSFDDITSHHMNSADKQLRQTAQELYNLSNQALLK
jgi:hypothetical protein